MKEKINSFFKIDERDSSITKEFIGGVTTFLAMAYILFVNANMLESTGMTWGAVFTATAIAAIVGSLIMGLLANFPIALAPGMGLNAVFAFTICAPWSMGFHWETGLAIVFVSGIIFLLLSLTGIREIIINSIPNDLKYAIGGGIGLFIAYIGLKNSGIISFDLPTDNPMDVVPKLGELKGDALLALFGLSITSVLYILKFKGSIFLGILATSVVGMVTGLVDLPSGIVSMPQAPEFGAFMNGFSRVSSAEIGAFIFAVITLLFIDFFDTAGTLVAVGRSAGLVDESGELEGGSKALLADSTATVVGAMVGTSNTTSYLESLTGIESGARTGLASVFTALLFVVALFFSPLLSVVTSAVTAPALIMVGVLMSTQLKNIDWERTEILLPVFLILLLMPLSYSIATGISFGFISYVVCMIAGGKKDEVSPLTYGLSVFFLIYYLLLPIILK